MSEQSLLEQVFDALKAEHDIYVRMHTCSTQQAELLAKQPAPVEEIARFMQEKAELAIQLEAMEERHRVIKTDWESHYQQFGEEERKPLAALKDDTMRILETLQELELNLAEQIREVSTEVSKELASIRKQKDVSRAYVPNPGPQRPHYFDKRN